MSSASWVAAWVALAGSGLATAAFSQTPAEEAFAGARAWTVQIRGAVEQPFIEDQLGSFSGAGLVVNATRGWVLTNAHVATHSHSVLAINFASGEPLRAERLYVDPHLDLAVIRYDPAKLEKPPVTPQLECDTLPPVGHPVGAFGHPWGFRFTGTRGITSAITSRLGPTMVQTDAPINSGNSGGPLISLETGRVVGINAAKIGGEDVEGLSFAVPMPYACTLLELLAAGRDPSPPGSLVDFAIDEYGDHTLTVARSRLPAGALDLRVGDEVLAAGADGRAVGTPSDLFDALRGSLDRVTLRVRRSGGEVSVEGRWPGAPSILARRGLTVAGALFAEAEVMTHGHLSSDYALMVHSVEPGSGAEVLDVESFDVLVSADGQRVPSLEALAGIAARAREAGRPVQLMLLRFAPEGDVRLFEFHGRSLPVEDAAWVEAPRRRR
ncbi:MAG: trypsin-like peptidase domain-containing protein [Steroidobacteraceae bacterium]|jgi:S1-C subfamily serine protease|nr:trypsin-like peptidase domain-containing protein [Steroidobacteraceae bacterium]